MLSQLDSSCLFFLVLRSREARSTCAGPINVYICRQTPARLRLDTLGLYSDCIPVARQKHPSLCLSRIPSPRGRRSCPSFFLPAASLGPGSRRGGCRRTYEAIPGSRMATRKGEHVAGQTFMARVDILQADERSEQMLDPLPVPSQLS